MIMRNAIISGLTAAVLAFGVAAPSFANTYTDSNKIGDWSADHIEILTELGVIAGYPDGTFRPTADITREEMAVMLLNGMVALENSIMATLDQRDAALYEELVAQQTQLLQGLAAIDSIQAKEVLTGRKWVGISLGSTAIDNGGTDITVDGKFSVLNLGDSLYVSVNPFVSTGSVGGASINLNKELGEKITVSAGAGGAIGWEDNTFLTDEAGDPEAFAQGQVEYNLSNSTGLYTNVRVPFTGDKSGDATISGGVNFKF